MKVQDIAFIVALLVMLTVIKKPNWFVVAGLVSLIFAIPLFRFWIFFTAERLVIYAFVFLLIAVLLNIIQLRHNKSSTFSHDEIIKVKKNRKVLDK